MIALGIDLSLENTGIVAVRVDQPLLDYPTGRGPDVVHLASVIPSPKLRGMARLAVIVDGVRCFLDQLVHVLDEVPDVVVFEGPGFNSAVAHSLGHVHGVVKLHVWQRLRTTAMWDLPPANLKQFVTDKGNSDKNVVMKQVFRRWGFDSDDDNLNDAYACALVGACKVTGTGTAFQLKVVTKAEAELYARPTADDVLGGPRRGAARRRAEAGQVAGRPRRRRVA